MIQVSNFYYYIKQNKELADSGFLLIFQVCERTLNSTISLRHFLQTNDSRVHAIIHSNDISYFIPF